MENKIEKTTVEKLFETIEKLHGREKFNRWKEDGCPPINTVPSNCVLSECIFPDCECRVNNSKRVYSQPIAEPVKDKYVECPNGSKFPIANIKRQNGLKKAIVELVLNLAHPDDDCMLADFLMALQYVLDDKLQQPDPISKADVVELIENEIRIIDRTPGAYKDGFPIALSKHLIDKLTDLKTKIEKP